MFKEHILACIHHYQNNNGLVNNLAKDVPPHDSIHNFVSSANPLKIILASPFSLEWLCAESNGSESIHDQVDPKKLDDVEGRVTKSHST